MKFLLSRTQKDKERILKAIEKPAQDPFTSHLDTKKLVNSQFYRLRIGTYRVVYDVFEEEVVILVLEIGNRGDMYK